MIRNEAERQFYLGVAGVRLWYARSSLPGAGPSPEFEFPEEATAEPEFSGVPTEPTAEVISEVAKKPAGKTGKPSRAINLQSLMETSAPESPDATTTPSAPEPEAKSGQQPGTRESKVGQSSGKAVEAPFGQKLNLRLWAGRRFLLVSDLSEEASLRLQETLAANILKSIGDQDARVLGPVLWPVFNNPLLPGNRLPDLVGVLKGIVEPLNIQQVILLGDSGSGEPAAGGHWFAQVLGREPELVFPHTLAELAGNPELKKKLWQLLKPFAECP